LGKKEKASPALKRITQNSKIGHTELQYRASNGYIQDMNREEKMREASKPLYLRRYE